MVLLLKSVMVSSHTEKSGGRGSKRGNTIRDKAHSGVGAEIGDGFQPHREEEGGRGGTPSETKFTVVLALKSMIGR